MLPACNGAMMRNIYQQASAAQQAANSRGYQYSGAAAGSINTMSAAARYPTMAAAAAAAYPPMGATAAGTAAGQPFGMPHTAPSMAPMGGRQDTPESVEAAAAANDWYNKGFNALRMNTNPHNHASLSAPMLQYQT